MRVKYLGLEKYTRLLQAEAGLIDLELEQLVAQLEDVERRWAAGAKGLPTVQRGQA